MRNVGLNAVLSLGLLGFMSGAHADEEKIALKDVPRAVLDAVKARFPGGEVKDASKEVEDGKTTYEIALNNKGKAIDLALTADGKITEIELEVAARDLPRAVTSAIEAKYPKASVKKAEEIIEFEGGKESKSYEVLLTTEAKKAIEVKLSPAGKILKTEEDDDKDD